MKQVLNWSIKINDDEQYVGAGRVVLVGPGVMGDELRVWTEETETEPDQRVVRVFGTGHNIPNAAVHLGSVVAKPFVWHVYDVGWAE